MPEVSIVMPVYNTKAEYLREAVESILKQTFKDFEFLIIDNGSEAYIERALRKYKDTRIKYLKINKNQGQAYARNYGIEKAKGTYVAFMDSDDVSLPERLEEQVKFLNEHIDIGCLGCTAEIIGDDAGGICFYKLKEHFEIEFYLAFSGCAFCQSSVMIRKSILDRYGIRYRTEWIPAEDYGLYVDLIGKTKFAMLSDVLVQYRFYLANTSHKYKRQQREKNNIIQEIALKKYCGIKTRNPDLLPNFVLGKRLSYDELRELPLIIFALADVLRRGGCSEKDIMYALRKRVKKIYYHTYSLKSQWALMFSPINKFLNLSFRWRLMCFITRGVFK